MVKKTGRKKKRHAPRTAILRFVLLRFVAAGGGCVLEERECEEGIKRAKFDFDSEQVILTKNYEMEARGPKRTTQRLPSPLLPLARRVWISTKRPARARATQCTCR
jgi:hypothetical protein